MKKIFTMILCMAGMLMSITSAQAAYTYNVKANSNGGGASGIWSILFSTNDWQTWSVAATPLVGPPNGSPSQLNFGVQNSSGVNVNATNNFGGSTDLSIGNIAWSASTGTSAGYTAPNPANYLKPTGGSGSGSTFNGSFKIASQTKVGNLVVRFTDDDGRSWRGTTAFTPEMPGGVLLLAALLPLGLMLRKKGTFQKNAV